MKLRNKIIVGGTAQIDADFSRDDVDLIVDALYELEGNAPKDRLEAVGRGLQFFELLQREMKEAKG